MKPNFFNSILLGVFIHCAAQGQTAGATNRTTTPITNASQIPLLATNSPTGNASTNLTNASLAPGSNSAGTNKPLVVTLDETTLTSLSPHPEPGWKNLLPLLSTLLGAIIALFGSYWATTRSHKLQVDRKKLEDAEFVRRLEACIATELDLLGQFYDNGIGKDIPTTPQPLRVHFALTEKWFTVFEANASHLGKLEEHKSASIIKIYGLMKSMVEYFRINNLLLDQLEALERGPTQIGAGSVTVRRLNLMQNMTHLASMLKDLEQKLKQEVKHFEDLRKSSA